MQRARKGPAPSLTGTGRRPCSYGGVNLPPASLEQVFDYSAGMMTTNERLAVASLTGIAEAHAQLRRLTWDEAMAEIQGCLANWKVAADRISEVLSQAASGYLDGETPGAPAALQLLIDAGADLDRARQIDQDRRQRPGLHIGVARLG